MIDGLVAKPATLTFNNLMQLPRSNILRISVAGLAALSGHFETVEIRPGGTLAWPGDDIRTFYFQIFTVSLSTQPPAITQNDGDAAVAQANNKFLIDQISLVPGRPRVSASPPDGGNIWRQLITGVWADDV